MSRLGMGRHHDEGRFRGQTSSRHTGSTGIVATDSDSPSERDRNGDCQCVTTINLRWLHARHAGYSHYILSDLHVHLLHGRRFSPIVQTDQLELD